MIQCRINHLAKAANVTGPALLGTPRLLFQSNFLFPVSAWDPDKHNAQQVHIFLGYYLFWNLSIAIYYIMQYQAVSLSYAPYDIIADTHCVTQDTTRVYW